MSFHDKTERLGPLVNIGATSGCAAFAVERDLVTNLAVRQWLARSPGRRLPHFVDREDAAPAVGLSPAEAAAYAASQGMRLLTELEWGIAADGAGGGTGFSAVGARGFCRLWEWTSTPHRRGFIVCGGVPRNAPEAGASVKHRSWEDSGAPDVAFRCGVSGEVTAA